MSTRFGCDNINSPVGRQFERHGCDHSFPDRWFASAWGEGTSAGLDGHAAVFSLSSAHIPRQHKLPHRPSTTRLLREQTDSLNRSDDFASHQQPIPKWMKVSPLFGWDRVGFLITFRKNAIDAQAPCVARLVRIRCCGLFGILWANVPDKRGATSPAGSPLPMKILRNGKIDVSYEAMSESHRMP